MNSNQVMAMAIAAAVVVLGLVIYFMYGRKPDYAPRYRPPGGYPQPGGAPQPSLPSSRPGSGGSSAGAQNDAAVAWHKLSQAVQSAFNALPEGSEVTKAFADLATLAKADRAPDIEGFTAGLASAKSRYVNDLPADMGRISSLLTPEAADASAWRALNQALAEAHKTAGGMYTDAKALLLSTIQSSSELSDAVDRANRASDFASELKDRFVYHINKAKYHSKNRRVEIGIFTGVSQLIVYSVQILQAIGDARKASLQYAQDGLNLSVATEQRILDIAAAAYDTSTDFGVQVQAGLDALAKAKK